MTKSPVNTATILMFQQIILAYFTRVSIAVRFHWFGFDQTSKSAKFQCKHANESKPVKQEAGKSDNYTSPYKVINV